jgi:hypothetical protein
VFALPAPPPLHAGPEVAQAFWLGLGELRAPGAYREITVTPHGIPLKVPAYVVQGRTIWGMTERILTPLLDRLGFVGPPLT